MLGIFIILASQQAWLYLSWVCYVLGKEIYMKMIFFIWMCHDHLGTGDISRILNTGLLKPWYIPLGFPFCIFPYWYSLQWVNYIPLTILHSEQQSGLCCIIPFFPFVWLPFVKDHIVITHCWTGIWSQISHVEVCHLISVTPLCFLYVMEATLKSPTCPSKHGSMQI